MPVNLGKMLADAMAQEGFAPPSGSGTADQALQAVAEAFLARVREAEKAESVEVGENNPPAALYGNVE